MSKSLHEFYSLSLSLQLKICLKRLFVAKGVLEKSVLKHGNSLENVFKLGEKKTENGLNNVQVVTRK